MSGLSICPEGESQELTCCLPAWQRDRSRVATLTGSALETHLQGEGPQGGDGDQRSHEEGRDVADGREGHAGSRALEALPGPVLRTRKHRAERCTEQVFLRAALARTIQIQNRSHGDGECCLRQPHREAPPSPNTGTGAFSVPSTHSCAVPAITTQNTKLQGNDLIHTVIKVVGTT